MSFFCKTPKKYARIYCELFPTVPKTFELPWLSSQTESFLGKKFPNWLGILEGSECPSTPHYKCSLQNRVTTDAQLQLRLIAEKLCTRVERRYEKRLLQQREKDRVDTDRKLADIRAEYAEQMEMRKREVDFVNS